MDTMWAFRQGYETARKLKESQDQYCAKALQGSWQNLGDFPDSLQWEMLVDVLRGRVKVFSILLLLLEGLIIIAQVHNHCYEPVDLDGIVRVGPSYRSIHQLLTFS
jgi:hypothetical protein